MCAAPSPDSVLLALEPGPALSAAYSSRAAVLSSGGAELGSGEDSGEAAPGKGVRQCQAG